LLQERQPDIWLNKLDWIAKCGGMVLLNTHPDYMAMEGVVEECDEYPVKFYKRLLDYIRLNYAGSYWHALPKEVAKYVSGNENTSTVSVERRDWSECRETIPQHRLVPVNAVGSPESASVLGETCISAAAQTTVHLQDNSAQPDLAGGRIVEPEDVSRISRHSLRGRRAAVVLFSHYPADPRPRRAADVLVSENMKVDLICLQGNKEELKRETINGVNVFRVPLKRRRGGKVTYIYQYSAFILASFVFLAFRSLKRRYDLVHVHNMPDVLVFSALVPKILGAKVILDLHDPMPELMMTIFNLRLESLSVRALKQSEKWSIRFADLALTPNAAFKRLFTSRSCPLEKMHIMMNSPEEEIFKFRPVSSVISPRDPFRPFVILYHGSLVARHGLDLAIDALQTVRKTIPTATIVICGESTPYFEEIMKSVEQRGLQQTVRYLGMRNSPQIVEAIEQCDLGIIPNRRSIFTEINMPTRIFEYLALGKPVIAPSTQGIQDYFSGQDLIFFEPDNVADLARKIEYVASHPQEVQDIIRRGQAIYQKHLLQQERSAFLEVACDLLGARER
jgi:glycosyltransferase involved in cell wall biosynthesis